MKFGTKIHSGDPKLTMTSQFLKKLTIDFSEIRGSGIRKRKKENELVFFRKLTLFKSKFNRCFLSRFLLEPLMHSNLDANFLGKL